MTHCQEEEKGLQQIAKIGNVFILFGTSHQKDGGSDFKYLVRIYPSANHLS